MSAVQHRNPISKCYASTPRMQGSAEISEKEPLIQWRCCVVCPAPHPRQLLQPYLLSPPHLPPPSFHLLRPAPTPPSAPPPAPPSVPSLHPTSSTPHPGLYPLRLYPCTCSLSLASNPISRYLSPRGPPTPPCALCPAPHPVLPLLSTSPPPVLRLHLPLSPCSPVP